jgi:RNA polymerase sigma factor (sigma-70 family)
MLDKKTDNITRDQHLLHALKLGDMHVFDQIYSLYRKDFVKLANYRFPNTNEADIVDAWQDALISFYEQIKSGKLQSLTCSLRSFLFLIGLRYLTKSQHYHSNIDTLDTISNHDSDLRYASDMELIPEMNEDQVLLFKMIGELPEQSRRMLLLRYLEGKNIQQIADEMNYQSENSISVTLSRTVKKLRELLKIANKI